MATVEPKSRWFLSPPSDSNVALYFKLLTIRCYLGFPIQVIVHTPEAFPDVSTSYKLYAVRNQIDRISVSVAQVKADDSLGRLSDKNRRCSMYESTTRPGSNEDMCYSECRTMTVYRACNCTQYFFKPYKGIPINTRVTPMAVCSKISRNVEKLFANGASKNGGGYFGLRETSRVPTSGYCTRCSVCRCNRRFCIILRFSCFVISRRIEKKCNLTRFTVYAEKVLSSIVISDSTFGLVSYVPLFFGVV